MTRVTAALILKNAEPTIRRALDSIAGLYDELVVILDDATTDDTDFAINKHSLCRLTKIINNTWTGFADARNLAQKHATGRWLLIIDGDEVLADRGDLLHQIKCADRNDAIDGIAIDVRTVHGGDKRVGSTGTQIRVYRNDPRLSYKFAIHNQLRGYREHSILPSTAKLDAHYPEDGADRWERNEGRLLVYRGEYPDRASEEWRHATAYLARGALSNGDHESAIRYAKEACEEDPHHVHASCWAVWVRSLVAVGAPTARIEDVIGTALEVQPNNPDVRWWDMQRTFSPKALAWAMAVQHPDNRALDAWSRQFVDHLPAAGKALGMTFQRRK